MHETAVGFVRDFVGTGKPVAAICHGPWSLVEAAVVRGRTITLAERPDRPSQRERERG